MFYNLAFGYSYQLYGWDSIYVVLRKMACKNDTDFDKSEGLHDNQWKEQILQVKQYKGL